MPTTRHELVAVSYWDALQNVDSTWGVRNAVHTPMQKAGVELRQYNRCIDWSVAKPIFNNRQNPHTSLYFSGHGAVFQFVARICPIVMSTARTSTSRRRHERKLNSSHWTLQWLTNSSLFAFCASAFSVSERYGLSNGCGIQLNGGEHTPPCSVRVIDHYPHYSA